MSADPDIDSYRPVVLRDERAEDEKLVSRLRSDSRVEVLELAPSTVEIDHTVSTWPRLGGDVALDAATVAAAVRRFGRGANSPPGRVRVDLDVGLDDLGAGSTSPGVPPPMVDEAAVITVSADAPRDYVRGGVAAERVWISATRDHLGVQPLLPVFLYARSDIDRRGPSAQFSIELAGLQCRFEAILGLLPGEAQVLVVRVSHRAGTAVRRGHLPVLQVPTRNASRLAAR